MKTVACKSCGWVHLQISRKDAEEELKKFNEFYDSASKETQDMYGSRSGIKNYEQCAVCGGGYKNFRPAKRDDCPAGCTIASIIDRKE